MLAVTNPWCRRCAHRDREVSVELLDAVLAFALTLAALATVVTVLMEILLRSVLMRKRNLVTVMRMLNDELPKGTLGLGEDERWAFFTGVVENPAEELGARMPSELGAGDTAAAAIGRVRWKNLTRGVYDKVSTEHVLRRLAELPSVSKLCTEATDKVKAELYRLACKYEEFGAAVSASFKRRSQFWSIVLGVVLAVVANVDGIRIFEAYQASPDLARTITAREGQIREAYERTESRRRAILAQETAVEKARSALAAAREVKGGDSPEAKAAAARLAEANEALAALVDPAELRRIAEDAQAQLESLVAMGVPIGGAYFPHCRIFGEHDLSTTCAGPGWPPDSAENPWAGRLGFAGHVLLWLVPVTITGMLIGLGAPFWFDVAKRLAEVRQMFGGTPSAETRLAARDAEGDPEKRDAIVGRVVDDAARTAAAAQ